MTIEDDIRSALSEREERSTATPPSLEEIHALASSDVRLELSSADGTDEAQRRGLFVQVGIAAAVVFALLVGGLVVLSNRDDDQGLPVVSGPAPDASPAWEDLPLLAPEGIEWSVLAWKPVGEGSPNSMVRFDAEGLTWLMNVGHEMRPSSVVADGSVATDGLERSVVTVDDRVVTIDRASSGLVDGSTVPGVSFVTWTDPSGYDVSLTASSMQPTLQSGGSSEQTLISEAPSVDLVVQVIAKIHEVSIDEWSAALQPAAGLPDPVSQQPNRPIRLGLPQDLASTALNLSPWVSFYASIVPLGATTSYELTVSTIGNHYEGPFLEEDPARPVSIRGQGGRVLQRNPETRGSGIGGDAEIALNWVEAGSDVMLFLPNGTTIEDGRAFADSLVVLDDAQWEALLFPGGSAPDVASTTTMADPDPTALPTSTVPTADAESADACRASGNAAIVFLSPEATAEEIAAVGTALETLDGVEKVTFIDQVAAYEEFKQLFADSPEMVDSVTPEILPTSYRIRSTTLTDLPSDIRSMPGVSEVVTC